jgi:microcystin-dependent protein
VGSVFIAVVSTNPATLLGYGTWAAFAAGRVLVGLDAGQAEFDTVEETGGAKTHTLTAQEMPAHVHRQQRHATTTGTLSGVTTAPDTTSSNPQAWGVVDTQSAGGGGAHNNLQPYVVVYMWKRTA